MSLFFKRFGTKKKNDKNQPQKPPVSKDTSGQAEWIDKQFLEQELEKNIEFLQKTTGNSSDIQYRYVTLGGNSGRKACIVIAEGLVENQLVLGFMESILEREMDGKIPSQQMMELLRERILPVSKVATVQTWTELFDALLSGESILLLDGIAKALAISTDGGEVRSIQEPTSEVSIRGPKDSFTESLITNTALIRRRIKNPNLWVEKLEIGKVTKTEIAVIYIKGIANDKIVQEVKERLQRIDYGQVLDSGTVEQFIEDQTYTPFPTVYHTERPDVVSANLAEGRVAIVCDGSPFVLTVPALFVEFFQVADDYYARFDISVAIRLLRVIVFFISLIAPATYVAITTFHHEMVPTVLLLSIAAQREAVPFPAFLEAFLMELVFEILREAGIRLPRSIGQTVSIVGALVIGQAAVEANLVSPAMVIVVSITGIASFATPSYSVAISARLIRFAIMILAAFIGFYGIVVSLMFMLLHLNSLRSFGVPYMEPLSPMIFSELGDSIVRMPIRTLKMRPKLISKKNIFLQKTGKEPDPFENKGEKKDTKGDDNE